MFLKLGSQDSLVISSPEHAKEIFKNHDLIFSERPKLIVLDLLVTNKQGYLLLLLISVIWIPIRPNFLMAYESHL